MKLIEKDLPKVDGKNILVRLDLNVPIKEGLIQDYSRIDKILDTDDTPPDVLKKIAKAQSEIDSAISAFQKATGGKL